MKKKKGFTLIELLAVIVILAIIALIATPIIMNVIENARKGSMERSAENYIDAVEIAVSSERLEGKRLEGEYTIQEDGNLCPKAGCEIDGVDKKVKIDMNGNKPSSGTIFIDNGLVETTSTMTIGDYTVSYDSTKKAYVASKEQTGNTSTIVYRWSEELISIGDTIDPTDTAEFTTDPTTLEKDYYLKYKAENNVVTESYACFILNNEEKCLRGGNSDFYGYNSNVANYTGNALILKGLQDEGLTCNFYVSYSYCSNGSVTLRADSNGYVSAFDFANYCRVYDDGSSNCGRL